MDEKLKKPGKKRHSRRDDYCRGHREDVRARGTGTGRWLYGDPILGRDGQPVLVEAKRGLKAGQLVPKREKLAYQRSGKASDGTLLYATKPTQTEAEKEFGRKLKEYEAELELRRAAGDAPTAFGAFAEWLIALRLDQKSIADTTATAYRERLKRIAEFPVGQGTLATLPLREITAVVLERLTAFACQICEGNGARNILGTVRTVLGAAVDMEILAKMPKGLKLPPKAYKDNPPPTDEEFAKVLLMAREAGDTASVAGLALYAMGMCGSEVVGLTADRAKGNIVTIDRQLRRFCKNGPLALAPLKTQNRRRQLVLSDELMALVFANADHSRPVEVPTIENRNRLSEHTVTCEFLITGKNGKPLSSQRLAAQIRRHAKAAGVEKFGLHDLRSSTLVDLTDAEFSVGAVAALLGHTPAVAMEHYMRTRPAKQSEASLARSRQLVSAIEERTRRLV
jgi:integrase